MFHVKQMTKNLIKTRIEKYLKKPVYKVLQNVSRETFWRTLRTSVYPEPSFS